MAKRRSEADRRSRQVQRLGRALRVLRLIQERHGRWDLPALARELGCSTKTVQRDLLALEEAQIPFYYDRQRCCYAVRPDFRLPLLDRPAGEGHPDPTALGVSGPSLPGELANSPCDQAGRLLADAERLVESLGRLYRSLRDAVPPHPSDSTEGDAP